MHRTRIQHVCDAISKADTTHVVLMLVNDHLTHLPGELKARLPVSCHPRQLRNADDVNVYAYDLRVHRDQAGSESAVVQMQLAAVMACASNRLVQLAAAPRGMKVSG